MWDRMQLVAVTPCFGGHVLPRVFHGDIASQFAPAPAAAADAA
ncbi:hypothetical protein ABIC09_001629 [Bradyrhizobium sp. S3.12.5]|nr:hypothetical protein [Bradyrhizobium cytisi]